MHIAKIGGTVLSANPEWLRVALNYTGAQGIDAETVDDYVEIAYQHGRSWLATNVRSLVCDSKSCDLARADQLEGQVPILNNKLNILKINVHNFSD